MRAHSLRGGLPGGLVEGPVIAPGAACEHNILQLHGWDIAGAVFPEIVCAPENAQAAAGGRKRTRTYRMVVDAELQGMGVAVGVEAETVPFAIKLCAVERETDAGEIFAHDEFEGV